MPDNNLNIITTNEIMEFLKDHMVVREEFNELINEIVILKSDMESVKSDMESVKSDMKSVKSEVGSMQTRIVTKEYLDDKLADLGAEIGSRINRSKERDQSFKILLIDMLKENNLLKSNQIKKLEEAIN